LPPSRRQGFPRRRILLENYRFSFLPVSRKKVLDEGA
jgi:hypothetical protein